MHPAEPPATSPTDTLNAELDRLEDLATRNPRVSQAELSALETNRHEILAALNKQPHPPRRPPPDLALLEKPPPSRRSAPQRPRAQPVSLPDFSRDDLLRRIDLTHLPA